MKCPNASRLGSMMQLPTDVNTHAAQGPAWCLALATGATRGGDVGVLVASYCIGAFARDRDAL